MPPQSDGTPPCGGAGEGVFGLGDFFTCSGAAARGVRGGLRDCFTRSGALIRRRRAAGETRRGLMRVLFLRFCGGRCCGWIEGGCEREEECEAELRGTHSQAELGNDIGLMGALLPFVLRVVAGACVGRGSGQPRMPPRERQHEGLGGLGDSFTRSGAASHACRRRSGCTRNEGDIGGLFHMLYCGVKVRRIRAGGMTTGRSNSVCGKIAQDVVHQVRAAID